MNRLHLVCFILLLVGNLSAQLPKAIEVKTGKVTTTLKVYPGIKSAEVFSPVEKRFALVMGVSSYDYLNQLPCVKNDVDTMRRALQKCGFDVAVALDKNKADFEAIIDESRQYCIDNGYNIITIYYSGHGAQFGNVQMLAPKDFLYTATDTSGKLKEFMDNSILLPTVIGKLNIPNAKAVLAISDACRSEDYTKASSESPIIPSNLIAKFSNIQKTIEGTGNIGVLYSSLNGTTSSSAPIISVFTQYLLSVLAKKPGNFGDLAIKISYEMKAKGEKQKPVNTSNPIEYDFNFFKTTSPTKTQNIDLYPIYSYSKERNGYIDKDGNVRIGFKYNWEFGFEEGYAPACYGNRWGLINTQGEKVIDYMYTRASSVMNGCLFVQINDKWGLITVDGKHITQCIYDDFGYFNGNVASFKKNEKWGFVNKNGDVIIDFHTSKFRPFVSDGLILAEKNGKYGFYDTSGKTVVDFIYDDASDFKDGFAIVMSDSKCGLINKEGEFVLYRIYDVMGIPKEGLVFVNKDDKYSYLNMDGTLAIDLPSDIKYATEFTEGLAGVLRNDKWGLIDKAGNLVVDYAYDEIYKMNSFGLYQVSKDGKTGIINRDGKIVLDISYDEDFLNSFVNGFAGARKDGKWSIIDTKGNTVLDLHDCIFEGFDNGLIRVKKDNMWGYMNFNGDEYFFP